MKEYLTKRYFIYLIRWIVSAIVMLPVMMFLESILPLWGNLLVGQIFGSLIFFKIDKAIFKDDTEIDISVTHPHTPHTPSPTGVSERKL